MYLMRASLLNCWVSAFIISISACAGAADFKWVPDKENPEDMGTVVVDGEIKLKDHKKLLAALGKKTSKIGNPQLVQLNSKGGNFEESMQIAKIVREKSLATRLAPGAVCLSACSIIFMSGSSFNNSFFLKNRAMHPSATLGFHAPTVSAAAGKFDSSDLENAYSSAVEQIGKKFMAAARYRDESWPNPLIKPGLINEMMIRRGGNYYFVDTVGKAAEFEIDLLGAAGPANLSGANRRHACENAISMVSDSAVAEGALKYWLSGNEAQKIDAESGLTIYSYELNRHKGRFCDVTPRDRSAREKDPYASLESGVLVGVGGAEQQLYVPDWYFWASDKQITTIPTQ
jgi:ATP-dependent protease ClpP protease subunit